MNLPAIILIAFATFVNGVAIGMRVKNCPAIEQSKPIKPSKVIV